MQAAATISPQQHQSQLASAADLLLRKNAGRLVEFPAKWSRAESTARKMAAMAQQDAKLPAVRRLAQLLAGNSAQQTVYNVWRFLDGALAYKLDDFGYEQLRSVARTWQDRLAGVDCDDAAIFAAALLLALGYQPDFALVRYEGQPGYSHVYTQLHGWGMDVTPPVDSFNGRQRMVVEEKLVPVAAASALGTGSQPDHRPQRPHTMEVVVIGPTYEELQAEYLDPFTERVNGQVRWAKGLTAQDRAILAELVTAAAEEEQADEFGPARAAYERLAQAVRGQMGLGLDPFTLTAAAGAVPGLSSVTRGLNPGSILDSAGGAISNAWSGVKGWFGGGKSHEWNTDRQLQRFEADMRLGEFLPLPVGTNQRARTVAQMALYGQRIGIDIYSQRILPESEFENFVRAAQNEPKTNRRGGIETVRKYYLVVSDAEYNRLYPTAQGQTQAVIRDNSQQRLADQRAQQDAEQEARDQARQREAQQRQTSNQTGQRAEGREQQQVLASNASSKPNYLPLLAFGAGIVGIAFLAS